MLSKISYLGSNYPYNMLKREQNIGSNYALYAYALQKTVKQLLNCAVYEIGQLKFPDMFRHTELYYYPVTN